MHEQCIKFLAEYSAELKPPKKVEILQKAYKYYHDAGVPAEHLEPLEKAIRDRYHTPLKEEK